MKIHFIGIGGIGMSGLSAMYKAAGYEVSGSDRGADKPENQRILAPLKAQGIRIYPQDGSFYAAEKSDIVVYSSAIEPDNADFKVLPETVRRMHRSEALQKIIIESSFKNSIAVSGSCGKSSVTAYLAETLLNCGIDVDCLNGAIIKRFQSYDNVGNFRKGDGSFFVFEADESDKSLVNYTPDYAIVLNMGTDHYSREELAEIFGTFVNNAVKGAVVARSVYNEILPFLQFPQKVTVFEDGDAAEGFYLSSYEVCDAVIANGNEYHSKLGDEAILKAYGMLHDEGIHRRELHVGFSDKFELVMPIWGRHNALNALVIFAMLQRLGIENEKILRGLENFSGTVVLYRNKLSQKKNNIKVTAAKVLTLTFVNGKLSKPISDILLDHGDYYWEFNRKGKDISADSEVSIHLTGEVFPIEDKDREHTIIGGEDSDVPINSDGLFAETIAGEIGFFNKDAIYQYITDTGGELSLAITGDTSVDAKYKIYIYVQSEQSNQFTRAKSLTVKAGEYTTESVILNDLAIKNNFYIQIVSWDNGKAPYAIANKS